MHIPSLALTLTIAAIAGTLPAQITALVNDPMSHGTLGDGALSLDEAIRVGNGEPLFTEFSAAELAQFRGPVPAPAEVIEIDASTTPTITLERQLSPVAGPALSLNAVEIRGVNGNVVLDGGGVLEIVPLHTNLVVLRHLTFQRGGIGVTFDTRQRYLPGGRATIEDCVFTGQSQAGLEVRSTPLIPGGIEPIDVRRARFVGQPVGLRVRQDSFAASIDVSCAHATFEGCGVGLEIDLRVDGRTTVAITRTDIVGGDFGIRSLGIGAGSLDLQYVHGKVHAARSAFDLLGASAAPTSIGLYHLDVRGGGAPADYALRLEPSSAAFALRVGESVLDGNILAQSGPSGLDLRLDNSHLRNGDVAIESTGPEPRLEGNVFESAPITVRPGTTATQNFRHCEFVRSPIDNQSAVAPMFVTASHLTSTFTTGVVVIQQLVPTRWIGRASVTPNDPPIGGSVDLAVDLQPQTAAAWLVGTSLLGPQEALGARFYFDITGAVALPGLFVHAQILRLAIPDVPALVGTELYAQPVVVPNGGQPFVPPWALPAGDRIAIQAR
ncbi:MAG: hypothetical protein AAF628_23760 [Planctomycetota bacterium]